MFQGPAEPRTPLLNHLSQKQMLLILASAEHLLDSIGLFSDVLNFSPGSKILVTSQESLKLQDEWVFDVQRLAVS
jgi:predicted ATPase